MSSPRRLLILAEGFSGDPHYGKTARGVLRYRPDEVVALLDSERAGETQDGKPIVGSVAEALPLGPTTALVGVATQGGRFPPAWRQLLQRSIEAGLDVENGLHEFISEEPELVALECGAANAGHCGPENRTCGFIRSQGAHRFIA